jgi:hypothetical protein
MKQNPNPEDAVLDTAVAMMKTDDQCCLVCRHYHGDGRTCDAFPKGIPNYFMDSPRVHTTPHDGDHGIQFEPRIDGR